MIKPGTCFKLGAIFGILTVVLAALLLFVDVQAIGPEGSKVGLASINGKIFDLTGFNEKWYNIADTLGKIDIMPVAIFGSMGAWQLFKTRNLMEVDKRIRALGVYYVIILIMYFTFTVVAVNYRPVLLEGELEPSFPSSHTMLAITAPMSVCIMIREMMENSALRILIDIICWTLMIITIFARAVSGTHWITDIVGAVFISLMMIMFLKGVLGIQKKDKRGRTADGN